MSNFPILTPAAESRTVNVRDFGATGDGTTDDRAAIAAADTAATAAGSFVHFPAGTYVVSSNITIANRCVMYPGAVMQPASGITVTLTEQPEAGWYQIFDHSASGDFSHSYSTMAKLDWWDDDAADYSTTLFTALHEHPKMMFKAGKTYTMAVLNRVTPSKSLVLVTGDVVLQGEYNGDQPRLDGDGSGAAFEAAIVLRDCDSVKVDNIEFFDWWQSILIWPTVDNSVTMTSFDIQNCTFLDAESHCAISAETAFISTIDRTIFKNNLVRNSGGYGAYITSAGVTITGNVFENISASDQYAHVIAIRAATHAYDTNYGDPVSAGSLLIADNIINGVTSAAASPSTGANGIFAFGNNCTINNNVISNIKDHRTDNQNIVGHNQSAIYTKTTNSIVSNNTMFNCGQPGAGGAILMKGQAHTDRVGGGKGWGNLISNNVVAAAGWYDFGYTHAYASATTFTVTGVDVTVLFRPGTHLKIEDATTLFAVVTASTFSTDTTVTVAVQDGSNLTTAMTSGTVEHEEINDVGICIFGEDYEVSNNKVSNCLDKALYLVQESIDGIVATVDFGTNTITRISGAGTFDRVWPGDVFEVTDADNTANNQIYNVRSVVGDVITVWETCTPDTSRTTTTTFYPSGNQNVSIKDNHIDKVQRRGIYALMTNRGQGQLTVSGNSVYNYAKRCVSGYDAYGIYLQASSPLVCFNDIKVTDNYCQTNLVGDGVDGGDDPDSLTGIEIGQTGARDVTSLNVSNNMVKQEFVGSLNYPLSIQTSFGENVPRHTGIVQNNVVYPARVSCRTNDTASKVYTAMRHMRMFNNRDTDGNLVHENWFSQEDGIHLVRILLDFTGKDLAVGTHTLYTGLGSQEIILKRAYWHIDTTLTSSTNAATLALSAGTTTPNIQTATAVNAAPYSTSAAINGSTDAAGAHLDGTVANMVDVTSNDGNIYGIVATEDITGGEMSLFLEYGSVMET